MSSAETLPAPEPTIDDPWTAHMRRGEWDAAWRISDRVLAERGGVPCWDLPRHEQWVWDGSPLDGRRVLVRCYHGLGDTLQFIRYAPLVRAVASHVAVWAQPTLLPLLDTAAGIDRLLPLHDGTPEAEYDVDVEVMELAHLFRSTPQTLPATVPYLHAGPAPLPHPVDGLAVGVVWQSGGWDPRRALPPGLLARLAAVPGITVHALQADAARDGLPATVHALAGDVTETARWMRAMDLVVSVDTMGAHLAGSLGVPVWTLLPHAADWRWMEERDDSPWYPTMRLFRQERPEDWEGVVARVGVALGEVAAVGREIRGSPSLY